MKCQSAGYYLGMGNGFRLSRCRCSDGWKATAGTAETAGTEGWRPQVPQPRNCDQRLRMQVLGAFFTMASTQPAPAEPSQKSSARGRTVCEWTRGARSVEDAMTSPARSPIGWPSTREGTAREPDYRGLEESLLWIRRPISLPTARPGRGPPGDRTASAPGGEEPLAPARRLGPASGPGRTPRGRPRSGRALPGSRPCGNG